MVEVTKERVGWVGLVTALVVFGGTMTMTQAEIESAYYCPLSNDIAIFDRLSDSMKTGYYTVEEVEYSLGCKEGRTYVPWVPLMDHLIEQGISFEDLLEQSKGIEADAVYVRGEQGLYPCVYENNEVGRYSKCYDGGVFKYYAGELICPAR